MSIHLLSLPAETLDSIMSYLSHPIDALNLSITCRYFKQHLSTEHSNKLWYLMFINSNSHLRYLRIIGGSPLPYQPACDYRSYVLRSLRENGCQFCLRRMQDPRIKKNRYLCLCRVYGFKICMGCTKKHTLTISQFRCLGLDLTTNPPKSTVAEVYNKKRFRKVPVTYWKFDIEALCIAQFGASLAHLQRRKAEAKIAMEAAKKANPSPLRRLRDQARARIGDAAWEIYDSKYAWEKICWCSGVTKEQVLAWLYLRPEDEVPVNANSAGDLNRILRDIRGKVTFAQKGEEWYRSVAEQLLDNMTEVLLPENGYRKLAREYHVKRVACIRGDLAGEIPADYICTHQSEHDDKAPFSCRSLMQFLKHMEVEHPGVYWGEDVWVGIPESVAQEYWDDWSGW